jgi:Flp pilus assembly protein TadG
MTRWMDARGSALVEAAVTIPILLLITVGIFEFGRAYQTWQVLTNAAREGARIAVLPSSDAATVETRVRDYLRRGELDRADQAKVRVNRNATVSIGTNRTATASEVTIDYPFDFIVLQPVVRLVTPGAAAGAPVTMRAAAVMRNEAQ